jgi:hypothetical protein
VVMFAERKAWRKISIMLHEGSTLQYAMEKLRNDHMFWIREVYERVGKARELKTTLVTAAEAENETFTLKVKASPRGKTILGTLKARAWAKARAKAGTPWLGQLRL